LKKSVFFSKSRTFFYGWFDFFSKNVQKTVFFENIDFFMNLCEKRQLNNKVKVRYQWQSALKTGFRTAKAVLNPFPTGIG